MSLSSNIFLIFIRNGHDFQIVIKLLKAKNWISYGTFFFLKILIFKHFFECFCCQSQVCQVRSWQVHLKLRISRNIINMLVQLFLLPVRRLDSNIFNVSFNSKKSGERSSSTSSKKRWEKDSVWNILTVRHSNWIRWSSYKATSPVGYNLTDLSLLFTLTGEGQ